MRRQIQRQTELGMYMAALRERLNETVTSLAEKARVASSSVSDIELGKRRPRRETLRKLSGPLGVDPNQLFLRAFLTQELRPQAIATTAVEEQLVNLNLLVTREQQLLLEEYLAFLRFRPLISVMKQNNNPLSA